MLYKIYKNSYFAFFILNMGPTKLCKLQGVQNPDLPLIIIIPIIPILLRLSEVKQLAKVLTTRKWQERKFEPRSTCLQNPGVLLQYEAALLVLWLPLPAMAISLLPIFITRFPAGS